MTKKFNKAAAPKINDYVLSLDMTDVDPINRQVKPFEFKRRLGDWVAAQTGCVPDIQMLSDTVGTDRPQMMIQCTEALLLDIQRKFEFEITEVDQLKKLSDIPPADRGCWKPHPKR